MDFTNAHDYEPTSLVFRVNTKTEVFYALPFNTYLWIVVFAVQILAYCGYIFPNYVFIEKMNLSVDDFFNIWKAITMQGNLELLALY